MKQQFFLLYLVSFTIYLTVGALQPAGVTTYLTHKEKREPMKKHLFRFSLFLLLCLSILSMAGVQTAADVPFANVPFDVNNIPEPVPPPKEVRDFFDLDPFYQQWINVEGFPVVASEKVSPYAIKEAAWQIGQMIGHRSDILKILAQHQVRLSILAHNEMTSDIPELTAVMVPHFFYNVRSRGANRPLRSGVVCSGEEVLLNSHAYAGLIHGFSHTIHTVTTRVDPEFDNRLKTTYNAAMEKGLWRDTYAATNRDEYWAEGVGSWFDGAHSDNPVKTRDALTAYDPDLATLIGDFFGDHAWRYTPLAMRLHLPHLQGFDSQSAPQLEYPPGALEAYAELRDPTINERSEWVNLPPHDPSLIPNLNGSRTRGRRTDILFVNLSGVELLLYRVDPDGTERLTYRFPPNPEIITQFTAEVGDLLLAKDATGTPLAVFQAVEKVGRALVGTTLNLIRLGLSKISGDNQTGISGAVLANPFVIEVNDDNLSVLEGISVTFTVTAGDGTPSVTRTMTDENGRAESTLTLGPNQGTNTVSVSAAGIEGAVTFTAVAEAPVAIPDPNLRAAIAEAIGVSPNTPILRGHLESLTHLDARNANITDLTGLKFATQLTELHLGAESVEGVGWVVSNTITDLSPVAGLTNLRRLELRGNRIFDISPLADLTNLRRLGLEDNSVSDLSPLSGLTHLETLGLRGNNISNLSPIAGLTNLRRLGLRDNNITDISLLKDLINLDFLDLRHTNISDLSPLVANTGLGSGDLVNVDGTALSYTSINTHIPILRERGVVVSANNLKPPTLEYLLSVPVGLNLIHVPLQVSAVDGVAKTIESISDLYDALGGVNTVNFLMTYDTSTQGWLTYSGNTDRGTASDKTLTDQMGIIAGVKAPTSVRLTGKPLGNNGSSTIGLKQGLNLVGLPLRDSRINRVSDLLSLDGVRGNVPVVLVTVNRDFTSVGRAGDPGDVPITGGQGFMLTAQQATTVTLSGEGWTNGSATAAVPKLLTNFPVSNTTPVLALKGSIVDEVSDVNPVGFRVTVKNLSTGRQVATTAADPETGYRLAVVDIETMRAAQVGDTLEISAQSFNPFIGVEPLWYTVTTEDVKRSLIQLPDLIAYEIPKETVLLANYPNPFNPETWIPYRLAEDADVKLTIYDLSGRVVRAIDVGHRIASAYESRSKAIYWDGRNNVGEQVSSGVYFYHLNAGDYSRTRKMLILK